MHQSFKLTDSIRLLQLVISSPLIHTLSDPSQVPTGIRTRVASLRGEWLTKPLTVHTLKSRLMFVSTSWVVSRVRDSRASRTMRCTICAVGLPLVHREVNLSYGVAMNIRGKVERSLVNLVWMDVNCFSEWQNMFIITTNSHNNNMWTNKATQYFPKKYWWKYNVYMNKYKVLEYGDSYWMPVLLICTSAALQKLLFISALHILLSVNGEATKAALLEQLIYSTANIYRPPPPMVY